ncbi:DUF805 domain-containing protein [Haemophilus haemoglobinophilus]|nr:DUF805 domain-containing protein [Canicola haemoglobinophilus]MBN6710879.1 DUF805 domain-containing protein [Canicola haemoglobinophilus]
MLLIESLKNWKNTSGRARRLEFGVVFLISTIILLLISSLAYYIGYKLVEGDVQAFYSEENLSRIGVNIFSEWLSTGSAKQTIYATEKALEESMMQNIIVSSITYILFLPCLVWLISTAIRRLHDIGTFGWWILLIGVPLWLFFDLWIVIAPMLFLVFKDGQRHYNKYGADPKNPNAPIPLETPKENENLVNFEKIVSEKITQITQILSPYWETLKQKWTKSRGKV